ncbi:MAG: cation transporter [Clostridia bacterium]|nr:cation transporter [Clostridia bacterium]
MLKITLKIEGMACGMCEAHVNDAIRRSFTVDKVSSSHKAGKTVIIAKQDIDDDRLIDTVAATGYTLATIEREPYEKQGLFAYLRKRK